MSCRKYLQLSLLNSLWGNNPKKLIRLACLQVTTFYFYLITDFIMLDVAVAFSLDRKEDVSRWLTSGEVAKVTDNQAKQWHQDNASFWANVIKPWVLIQPINQSDASASKDQIH